jgi:menaquinol-cytochrome c reductase cytochrome b/c subunit
MAEVPEHLLKRSQERRKALGLPVEGEEADAAPAADAPEAAAAEDAAVEAAPAAAAADGDVITEDKGGIPAHLLERSRKRKAALAGGGGEAAAGGGVGTKTAAAAAVAAPAPTSSGPGGHTQRLLTVVKSGSIQQARAEAQDKVHVWPHLLAIELASILSLTAFVTIFSALVKAPLLGLADVNQTPNPSKAPWYFLGLQELLKMFHPMVAGVTIPGVALGVLAITPYIDKNPSNKPNDRRFAIVMLTMFLMMWAVLVILGSVLPGRGLQLRLPLEQGHLLRVVGAHWCSSRSSSS